VTGGCSPILFAGAVDGRCLRHVQDDRTDPGMLGGKGLELIRRTAGRKHHVQRLREADDGGPPDPFPTRW
jgi:hypothetical protein